MLQAIKGLLIYQIPEHNLISRLAEAEVKLQESSNNMVGNEISYVIKQILELATKYCWNENLWQCYLTYHLCMDENSYTLSKERRKDNLDGSIQTFLLHDLKIYQTLFHYDFSLLETACPFPCFALLTNYHAVGKRKEMVDGAMGELIMSVAKQLAQAKDEHEMLEKLDHFYEIYGIGEFAFHKAFRIRETQESCELLPIRSLDAVVLDDLIGYESQKQELLANTKSFLAGQKANNVLLYGESGTGKSTSIKAIANMFYEQGLRLIEVHKHQFHALHELIEQIKTRNYRYIIYMDDLSFEEDETEYKYLKAVIEGGLETKPNNILIYATSNRRHLIKETWRDRNDVVEEHDLHISETMSEKLSLAARFGISIYYGKPSPKEYQTIVHELAKREELSHYDEQELWQLANAWELRHGGMSGRCARQLIDYLCAAAHHE